MKQWVWVLVCVLFTSVFIYPIFQGLILLPLDLLVTNSGPWHLAGTILLKNSYMQDSVLQMFPWKHLTFTSLTSGIVPLWNPYQFTGMPFMASMKPMVFYPTNILFILGELRAWNIHLWLQLFLSLWFTFLLVSSLGVSAPAALLAGIAFAFNSVMVGVLEFSSEGHVLLWLPILLYFVKRYADTKRLIYVAAVVPVTAAAIFAGHLQYFTYEMIVVVAFSWFYGKTLRPFLGLLLGTMIAGVQLVPGIELFRQSARGIAAAYDVFANGLLRPEHLLRLLSPDWFGNPVSGDLHTGYIETSGYFGIIPLFFSLYAIVQRGKNQLVRFFGIVGGLAVLFSMNGIAQVVYFLRVPVISSGYGSRLFSMVLFSFAVLSGFGLDAYVRESKRNFRSVFTFTAIALGIFAAALVFQKWNPAIGVTLRNVRIQVYILVAFFAVAWIYTKFKLPGLILIAAVLVLTFADLFRMGYRFLTFSNSKFFYPDIPITRFLRDTTRNSLGRIYGVTEPEVNTVLRLPAVETYNPLYPLRTVQLFQTIVGERGQKLMNNKYYLSAGKGMKMALDFAGVEYIVVSKDVNPALELWHTPGYETLVTKVFSDDHNDVYKNNTVYPRYGLFYDVRTGVPDEDVLDALSLQSVDFRKTLLFKEEVSSILTTGTGSAHLVSSDVNSLTFRLSTSTPAAFYISDAYDSGWRATVNGTETPVYHANYNFRGVMVPKGDSTLVLRYLPGSVIVGVVVSLLGLVGTALLVIQVRRSKHNGNNAYRNSRFKRPGAV